MCGEGSKTPQQSPRPPDVTVDSEVKVPRDGSAVLCTTAQTIEQGTVFDKSFRNNTRSPLFELITVSVPQISPPSTTVMVNNNSVPKPGSPWRQVDVNKPMQNNSVQSLVENKLAKTKKSKQEGVLMPPPRKLAPKLKPKSKLKKIVPKDPPPVVPVGTMFLKNSPIRG